jgi:hypothetical protein
MIEGWWLLENKSSELVAPRQSGKQGLSRCREAGRFVSLVTEETRRTGWELLSALD